MSNMQNHHPKPEPIKLGTARTNYATAYANRPPTKRLSCWSWKMCIHEKRKQQFLSLGRLDRKDGRGVQGSQAQGLCGEGR